MSTRTRRRRRKSSGCTDVDIRDLAEHHQLIRRLVLFWVLALKTAAVGVGLYHLLDLTAQSVTFLLAVLAMLDAVVLYYFHIRSRPTAQP